MGQLESWKSDRVLPSLSPFQPVCLDEELFGVETLSDGTCSLWGAERGRLAVFNPATRKYAFHPTSMKSGCISKGAAVRSVMSIAMLQETFVWTSQDRDMGRIFWEGHRPSSASDEG